jgi:hypothetical protein
MIEDTMCMPIVSAALPVAGWHTAEEARGAAVEDGEPRNSTLINETERELLNL